MKHFKTAARMVGLPNFLIIIGVLLIALGMSLTNENAPFPLYAVPATVGCALIWGSAILSIYMRRMRELEEDARFLEDLKQMIEDTDTMRAELRTAISQARTEINALAPDESKIRREGPFSLN